MPEVSYLTENGFEKMQSELHQLTTVGRKAIAKQIEEARDKGDLSENAEYKAAKEAQDLLELRISKIEDILSNARIIKKSELDKSKVLLLAKVKLKNTDNGKVMTFTIVPENESDVKSGKISVSSPIAKGLLGKKKGEKAKIETPAGKMNFQVLEISA